MSQSLQDLKIGKSYSKAELRSLLDEPTLVSKTAGIFYCRTSSAILLFVTLEKAPDKPNYNDYFENQGRFFHWDSQNKQHINTPAIQNIATGRTQPYLFVRKTEKSGRVVRPFIYFGALSYDTYDKSSSNPVHIRFRVNSPLQLDSSVEVADLYRWRPQRIGNTPSHSIPDVEPSEAEKRNYTAPTVTERLGLVTSRVGQGYYRDRVIEQWGGQCPLTGISKLELLIASHIVPWKDATDAERLDPHNGILLSPNADALFDRHLISFDDEGRLVLSTTISSDDLSRFGIDATKRIPVSDGMRSYLERHREQTESH